MGHMDGSRVLREPIQFLLMKLDVLKWMFIRGTRGHVIRLTSRKVLEGQSL